MKWRGETEAQWWQRVLKWHPHYCLIPTQMNDGTWVWLEQVWRRAQPNCRGGYWFEYDNSDTQPVDPQRSPPPPKPSKP